MVHRTFAGTDPTNRLYNFRCVRLGIRSSTFEARHKKRAIPCSRLDRRNHRAQLSPSSLGRRDRIVFINGARGARFIDGLIENFSLSLLDAGTDERSVLLVSSEGVFLGDENRIVYQRASQAASQAAG